ncbi:hypothetical protein H8E52_08765 [bacterium]|nr:hypothetical protein [bacterium]
MKKLGFISILLVLLPLASQAEDCVFNLMAQGWGFNDGEEIGDHWGVVGLLEPIQPENPPIDFDFVANEVSFAILDMEIDSVTGTDIAIFELGGGSVGIYEDPSFNFDPGSDPFDGIISATDGSLALGGEGLHATLIINNILEIGTILGEFDWSDGTYLDDIEALGPLLWSFNFGISFSSNVNVPTGYHSLWVGRFYSMCPTASEPSTWTELKNLY